MTKTQNINFEFAVCLKSETSYLEVKSPVIIEKIINFYEQHAVDLCMNNMKITHVKDDIFSGNYDLNIIDFAYEYYKLDIDIEMFVDFDDNYSLKIGKSSYLIIGKLLSINGQPI